MEAPGFVFFRDLKQELGRSTQVMKATALSNGIDVYILEGKPGIKRERLPQLKAALERFDRAEKKIQSAAS
jgi:hypothetical protein